MSKFTYEHPRPIVTVDVVLFTVVDEPTGGLSLRCKPSVEKRLKVALVPRAVEPFPGVLALPGTYLRIDEETGDEIDDDLEAAAARCLRQKCGLDGVFLEQLKTYSGPKRDPRGLAVTTAYYALVSPTVFDKCAAAINLADAVGLTDVPFDHAGIVADGVARIRGKATYTTLPAMLVPKRFTLLELEKVYEAVLGRPIQTSFFRKKMMELVVQRRSGKTVPFLRETDWVEPGAGRPARLYEKATDELIIFPQRF
jgi:ADP-ribose pyrophosphatase YjhB (NUDIX family)